MRDVDAIAVLLKVDRVSEDAGRPGGRPCQNSVISAARSVGSRRSAAFVEGPESDFRGANRACCDSEHNERDQQAVAAGSGATRL